MALRSRTVTAARRPRRPAGLALGLPVGLPVGLALVALLLAGCGQPEAPSQPLTVPTSSASLSSPRASSPAPTATSPGPSAGTHAGAPQSSSPPAVTTAPTPPVPSASPTARRIDAAAASLLRLQLQCPSTMGIHVLATHAVPAMTATEVVAAECASGAGSPPSGVYTLTGAGSVVQLGQTLVAPSHQVLVRTLTASSAGVQLGGLTFSTPTVPRCCPDRSVSMAWTVQGKSLVPQTD